MMEEGALRLMIETAQEAADAGKSLVEIDGVTYTNDTLTDPRTRDPVCEVLEVTRLSALCDYVLANRDEIALEKCIVHIGGPRSVMLMGPITGRFRQRESYVRATAHSEEFPWGKFMSQIEFNTMLLSRIAPGIGDRDELLKLARKITVSSSVTTTDDAKTQSMEARRGMTLAEEVTLPNPVSLAPYRTFSDFDPPASAFIIRAIKREDNPPTLALFEADGGAWMLDAAVLIENYLAERIGSKVAILG